MSEAANGSIVQVFPSSHVSIRPDRDTAGEAARDRLRRATPIESFVIVDGVSKTFSCGSSSIGALPEFSMQVGRGEFVVVLGEPSSGKTTLVELICALQRPSTGRIVVAGSHIGVLRERALLEFRTRQIALVPERPMLAPSLSARETVVETAALNGVFHPDAFGDDLLAAVGLSDCLDTPAGSLPVEDQQCLSIARALAKDAPLLLADDPTAPLHGPRAEAAFLALHNVSVERCTTVILTSSDPALARAAGRLIELPALRA